jgi:hypothetical protein
MGCEVWGSWGLLVGDDRRMIQAEVRLLPEGLTISAWNGILLPGKLIRFITFFISEQEATAATPYQEISNPWPRFRTLDSGEGKLGTVEPPSPSGWGRDDRKSRGFNSSRISITSVQYLRTGKSVH